MARIKKIVFVVTVIIIASFVALFAFIRPAEEIGFLGNFIYAPFAFFLVIFGVLWVKIIFGHLSQETKSLKKWYIWFFGACITFWWLGIQLNHYLFFATFIDFTESLSPRNIFAHINYLSWVGFASLGIAVGLGAVALVFYELIFNHTSIRQKKICFALVLLFIGYIGFLTNDLFRKDALYSAVDPSICTSPSLTVQQECLKDVERNRKFCFDTFLYSRLFCKKGKKGI